MIQYPSIWQKLIAPFRRKPAMPGKPGTHPDDRHRDVTAVGDPRREDVADPMTGEEKLRRAAVSNDRGGVRRS